MKSLVVIVLFLLSMFITAMNADGRGCRGRAASKARGMGGKVAKVVRVRACR